jgi:hypothetical protein
MVRFRDVFGCRHRVAVVLAVLTVAVAGRVAHARQVLFVTNSNGSVGEYNAVTGATINSAFIPTNQGLSAYPYGLALDNSNHLFVASAANNTIGEYDATTGATINAAFISQGLSSPHGLAIDGNNHVYVANQSNNTVGEYNATTGTVINSNFLNAFVLGPFGLAVDGNNHLFVANTAASNNINDVVAYNATTGAPIYSISGIGPAGSVAVDALNHLFVSSANGIGEYNATTGAVINSNLVQLPVPEDFGGLAVDGSSHLFVNIFGSNTGVLQLDATSGAIGSYLITDFNSGMPVNVIYAASVPEPSSLLLVAAATVGGMCRRRFTRH